MTKELVFLRQGSDVKFTFFNQVELVNNKFLFKHLIVEHVFNEDSLVKPVLDEGVELVRIKIRVNNVGSFYFDFDSAKISEKREELLNKISELRSIENDDLGKTEKMLTIIQQYEPLYCFFYDGKNTVLKFEQIQEIFAKQNITFHILVFLESEIHPKKVKKPFIVLEDAKPREKKVKEPKEKDPNKKSFLLKNLFKKKEENKVEELPVEAPVEQQSIESIRHPFTHQVEQPKVETPSVTPVVEQKNEEMKKAIFKPYYAPASDLVIDETTADPSEMSTYHKNHKELKSEKVKKPRNAVKFHLPKIKFKRIRINWNALFQWHVDYLFIALFALLFAFGILAGTMWALNRDSLCAFLYVLGGIFLVCTIYATYATRNDHKEWKYDIQNTLMLNISTIVGLTIGIIASYFTAKSVMNVEEGKVINYAIALWSGIGSSFGLLIFVNAIPPVIKLIINKLNKNKQKPQKPNVLTNDEKVDK